jgi:hypothetical protein
LEEQLQRKLNLPRRVVRTGHYHLAECRTYRASSNLISGRYLVRRAVIVLVIRNEIARSVCQIRDLRAELQIYSFRYRKILKDGERKITEVRAVKGDAAAIANGAQQCNLEGIVIEEFGVARVGQAGIRDLVRTCRAASDAVEQRVAKAGEVVGDAEGRSGIPHENSVPLPAGQA